MEGAGMNERLDSRGWIAIGSFALVIVVFLLIAWDRTLLQSDAFLVLAAAIVLNGWVQGPVGWAYQATKGGGELAEQNTAMLKQQTEATTEAAAVAERKKQ
jgi:hypothetical protein